MTPLPILLTLALCSGPGATAPTQPTEIRSSALLGIAADDVLPIVRAASAPMCNRTIEQCGGQLTVEDGCGRRIAIPRGQWVTIDNGCRNDLIWFCGNTQEISRGVRGRAVQVFHSCNGRRIDICW